MRTLFYLGIFAVAAVVSWRWIKGIDYMKENHPDYKGEDLFDESDIS